MIRLGSFSGTAASTRVAAVKASHVLLSCSRFLSLRNITITPNNRELFTPTGEASDHSDVFPVEDRHW
jgi:hypothetical protein